MKDEIKEILERPNVYSFNDECYLYFGDYNKLKDYITNLQEENERLKNGYCELKVKCNNGECDCTNEEYDGMAQSNMKNYLLLEDYKTRIDKAIEYIEYIEKNSEKLELNFVGFPDSIVSFKGSMSTLLKILKGSDE